LHFPQAKLVGGKLIHVRYYIYSRGPSARKKGHEPVHLLHTDFIEAAKLHGCRFFIKTSEGGTRQLIYQSPPGFGYPTAEEIKSDFKELFQHARELLSNSSEDDMQLAVKATVLLNCKEIFYVKYADGNDLEGSRAEQDVAHLWDFTTLIPLSENAQPHWRITNMNHYHELTKDNSSFFYLPLSDNGYIYYDTEGKSVVHATAKKK